ncbi:MAG: hypothetical protein H0X40_18485 [Chthoniobacterales bacterium]|nr:hypothetical protein [Chthoniobacterales bacterium]
MSNLRKIRFAAAIVLLGAIFLPLSECERGGHHARPSTKTIAQRFFPQTNEAFTYEYGCRHIGFTVSGGLTLLAFAWPLISLLAVRKPVRFPLRLGLQLLELLLCAGTIYWLNILTMGGRWLYGIWVALTAVLCFTTVGFAAFFVRPREPTHTTTSPFRHQP